MAAQLMCPNIKCKKVLSVPDEARGKVVRCSHCQTAFRVPTTRRIEPGEEQKRKSA
jgi:LSD1 subclass zinc finger protein